MLISVLIACCCWVRFAVCLGSRSPWKQHGNCGNSSAPTVTVKNGSYVGLHSPEYGQDFFLGMPYAQKAVRFTQAEPLNATWNGTRSATAYPPHCVGYGPEDVGYPVSEDCLYLNVIRPAGISATAGLPVAVWIHGGGLFMGGSADRRYKLSFIEQHSAESVSAHVLAYNGRDDGLFRGVVAESGFGGFPPRFAGGLNATAAQQAAYDALVAATSCAPTAGTAASLACLRALPLAELNAALNGTVFPAPAPGPWPPVIDGDFVADYPGRQLAAGRFVRVPALIGGDTDEGTAFLPAGLVAGSDEEVRAAVEVTVEVAGINGDSEDPVVDELLRLYPDVQAVGTPGLDKFPVIVAGDTVANASGLQYRRAGAFFGDMGIHYACRRASLAWSQFGVPLWSYRFDVVANGVSSTLGTAHFQEVAFVFDNRRGDGYAVKPLGGGHTAAYTALAGAMSSAWVNFFTGLDPNPVSPREAGRGEERRLSSVSSSSPSFPFVSWPAYNATAGGGVGQNIVWRVLVDEGDSSAISSRGGNNDNNNSSRNGIFPYFRYYTGVVEWDSCRAEGISWMMQNALGVFGM